VEYVEVSCTKCLGTDDGDADKIVEDEGFPVVALIIHMKKLKNLGVRKIPTFQALFGFQFAF